MIITAYSLRFLRIRNRMKPTTLYISYTYSGKQYRHNTGIKAIPHYWHNGICEVSNLHPRRYQQFNRACNEAVDKLKDKIDNWLSFIGDGEFVPYNEFDKPVVKKQPVKKDLLQLMKEAISKKDVRESSKNTYLADLSLFERFLQGEKIKLTDKTLNADLLKRYEKYLSAGRKTSTIKNNLMNLLSIIGELVKDGVISEIRYSLPKSKEETVRVVLTDEELKLLSDATLSGTKDKVRDLFILQCETGLRVSDVLLLNSAIITETLITIKTKKTGATVTIPLSVTAKQILNKYDKLPVFEYSYYSRQIASVCKEAGIDAEVLVNGERVKKHSLITSHTGRRTFVTRMLAKGYDTSIVMRITGHKSVSAFNKYVNLSSEDIVKLVKL